MCGVLHNNKYVKLVCYKQKKREHELYPGHGGARTWSDHELVSLCSYSQEAQIILQRASV